jgi:hypothetical protein
MLTYQCFKLLQTVTGSFLVFSQPVIGSPEWLQEAANKIQAPPADQIANSAMLGM